MNCKEATQLISPYLDGILQGKERMTMQQHLDHCSLCREHYRDMTQLSSMLRSMGKDIKPAPLGFSNAVMLAVREDAVGAGKPRVWSGWVQKTWKKTVPAAAAAVLLFFASVSGLIANNAHLAPIAVQEEPQYSYPASENVTEPSNQTALPGTKPVAPNETPDSPKVIAENPSTVNGGSVAIMQGSSAPVLLSEENRNILSTMLVIRSEGDPSTTFEQVRSLASPYGASAERLGQQVKDGVNYSLFKLVVDRNQNKNLTDSMATLGTVVSRDVDKQDISKTYAQALNQFLSLSTQRGETQDPAKLKQLDQQIASLQQQLGDWKQKASLATVVLWIQN